MPKKLLLSILFISFTIFGNSQYAYLNFDGQNDYVQVPNNMSIDYSGNFSLEIKFKRERTSTREDIITKKDFSTANNSLNDVAIFMTADNKVNVLLRESISDQLILTSNTLTNTNDWIHVAFTRIGNSCKLYINGNLEDTGSFNNNLSSTGPFRIGSNRQENMNPNGNATSPFDGNIDEVRIWNYGRSASEISNNINSNFIGNEIGLVANYNFEQGIPCGSNPSETKAIDLTNINTRTLNNFDLSSATANPCHSNWNGRSASLTNETDLFNAKLYPNPTNSSLKIEFEEEMFVKNISVYSLLGNSLNSFSSHGIIKSYEINLTDLQPGAYLIVITNKELKQSVYRVVKR